MDKNYIVTRSFFNDPKELEAWLNRLFDDNGLMLVAVHNNSFIFWNSHLPTSESEESETYTLPHDEDQPFTCPHCGRRTNWEGDNQRQVHTCKHCNETYIVEVEAE